MIFGSQGEADTRALGRKMGSFLRPGDVLVLRGELGAGKTVFVSGLAEGLGIGDPVTSPSFVLVRRYDGGFIPLVHADAYRLNSLAEFDDLGVFEEAEDAVLVIEWGDAVASELPEDYLVVHFEVMGEGARRIHLVPHGAWVRRSLEELG